MILTPSSTIRAVSRCSRFSSVATSTTSNGLHFYRNNQLELWAAKEAKRLSLRQLVFFGRSINESRLIKSANYVRTELPIRIAHRIRDIQALPFVVVTQESIAKVYELYWTAFEKIRRFPPIESLDDNDKFCKFLQGLLAEHTPVIPDLALGLSLSSHHLSPEDLDSFMRRMLVSRISRRTLVRHHIALSNTLAERDNDEQSHVGIIYTNLSLKESIQRCFDQLNARPYKEWAAHLPMDEDHLPKCWPGQLVIDGHVDTKFAYIRDHLDYIVHSLLKNSMLATWVSGQNGRKPFIRATIVAGPDDVHLRISDDGGGLLSTHIAKPSDLYSFSHIRNSGRLMTDRLGALRDASATGRGSQAIVTEGASTARIGLGLPMSNIYATYFGGGLNIMSLDGWGTDVYLRLPKLGTNLEGIEL